MSKTLTVNCPTCSKNVAWLETSIFRPFCSDRCKQIDLGAWADESYSIPTEVKDEWELADQQSQLDQAVALKYNEQRH